ncbi:glycosyltransferase [Oribacterium sp. WCC10]|uniref:glycosyltransferase n=1 Tax=Oribacterium sp. WCC10 TaxID=1855343 RepID=UPI0008EB035D|nr:glycosyltransferase [Oribacterium sp. WCC10]SFG24232.1 Glycosyl transferase family 2 [Oribacterium sp. WCC10]
MNQEAEIRLSQTLIVKNEEKNIASALSWGKNIVCEQIVVDTGSTDNTVRIAEEMGARVIYFEWIDDFSAAKNKALDSCIGDWIAILDADEYFVPGDTERIIEILKKAEKEGCAAVNTSLTSIDGNGGIISSTTQIRILKNISGLRYKRRIHEILTYDGPLKIYDATKELNIIHTGYAEEIIKEKRASGRNRRLLEKELEDNPNDPEILGYLGDEYTITNNDKAEEFYRRAIDNLPVKVEDWDTRSSDTFTKLIVILGLKNEEKEIDSICEKAEAVLPKNADFSYYTGVHYYNKKDYVKALEYFRKAFHKLGIYGEEGYSENLISNLSLAYAQYAFILMKNGDMKGAVTISSNVLKNNKKEYVALLALLGAFISEKTPLEPLVGFLGKLYDFDSSIDKLLLYRGATETDYLELKDFVFGKMNDIERTIAVDRMKG